MYGHFAVTAREILQPGGVLVCTSGNLYVNLLIRSLDQHLRFLYMGNLQFQRLAPYFRDHVSIKAHCRPVLVYTKGRIKPCKRAVFNQRGPFPIENSFHEYQLPLPEAMYYINAFTVPNDLVVDLCAGSFTVAAACKQLGRRFVGCDIAEECVAVGRRRLANLRLTSGAAELIRRSPEMFGTNADQWHCDHRDLVPSKQGPES